MWNESEALLRISKTVIYSFVYQCIYLKLILIQKGVELTYWIV